VHLGEMAMFALATGLRAANVTRLTWEQVDLSRNLAWVHPDQAKARKAISVPLNAEAVLLIRKQLGRHATHVFSFKGQRITQVSTKAWYKALKRAGTTDFRWHDLRHTFASRLVMKGVDLRTVQELMGHKTITMTLRYSHLSPAHQLEAVQGLNRPATGTSTKAPKAPGLPELFLGN